MIKDRGNIKWQGMILTEHNALLKEWEKENELIDRPELEEWEQTLIADEIERAHKSKATIKVNYWRNGYVKSDYGKVIQMDIKSESIVLDDPFGTTRYSINEIVALYIIT